MAAALCDQWNSWLTRNSQTDTSLAAIKPDNKQHSAEINCIVLDCEQSNKCA